jgi:hypothetical protein
MKLIDETKGSIETIQLGIIGSEYLQLTIIQV